MIRLYLKITEKFVNAIFQDEFWVVNIPFVRIVKFNLLAQFPVHHLATQSSRVLYCFCAIIIITIIIKKE